MKKILFLITKGDNIGGAQIYVRDLAFQFNKDGYEIIVVAGNSGEFTNQLEEENIKTIIAKHLKVSISPLSDVLALFELIRIIKKSKPDIVCINSSKSGIIGRLACKFTGTPNVFIVHGWSFTNGLPLIKVFVFKFIERCLKNFSHHWICVSDFDYQLGLHSKVFRSDKTIVIKNGIKKKKIIRKENIDDNITRLIFIARHDHQKDHKTVFKALQNITNIQVMLIGDGPLLEYNKQLAKSLGIENKVQFLGFQKHIDRYLAQAHIFILVSNWEGFPLSTLEAMSAGIPVIVTNVGGAAEAIVNGKDGFVIEQGDVATLSEKISLLQNNKEIQMQMGLNAQNTYLQNFTFDKMYNKTQAFLLQILNQQ